MNPRPSRFSDFVLLVLIVGALPCAGFVLGIICAGKVLFNRKPEN
jgi:hypothetical protein